MFSSSLNIQDIQHESTGKRRPALALIKVSKIPSNPT